MGIVDAVANAVSDVASKAADVLGVNKDAQKSGSTGTIRIQYYRSFIAAPKTHKQIVRSAGLTKLNQIVERPDTPAMRGFVKKVPHLLRLVD
ncbi:MAG: 50S ribosomal protein L30 [Pyrinomonadaceae bacterium]